MYAIEKPKDLDFMTINEVTGLLQANKEKIKKRQEEPLELVLKTKTSLKNDEGEKKAKNA